MKGKSLTIIGTAITLAFTSNVAMAESSNSSISAPTEIKMSLEGMKILCEHFPLNSRCPNGTPINANVPTLPPVVESSPGENNINSDTNVAPESSSSTPDNSNQLTPVPESSSAPKPDNSSQLTPVPESSSTPDNSGQLTPVPESSSAPKPDNSGSTSDKGFFNQVPTTIVPKSPAPGIRTP